MKENETKGKNHEHRWYQWKKEEIKQTNRKKNCERKKMEDEIKHEYKKKQNNPSARKQKNTTIK